MGHLRSSHKENKFEVQQDGPTGKYTCCQTSGPRFFLAGYLISSDLLFLPFILHISAYKTSYDSTMDLTLSKETLAVFLGPPLSVSATSSQFTNLSSISKSTHNWSFFLHYLLQDFLNFSFEYVIDIALLPVSILEQHGCCSNRPSYPVDTKVISRQVNSKGQHKDRHSTQGKFTR